MKKIIGIVGSPRKNGNTYILVSKILEGARKEGANVELLFLKDLDIKECDGCHVCLKGKDCRIKDDMIGIYTKIIESDAIIFGTPVYWYAPTALMKLLIDRLFYFLYQQNAEKLKNKLVVIASPYDEHDPEVASPMVSVFEKIFDYFQMKLVAKILVSGVTEKRDILKKKDSLEEAYNIGVKLANYKL